MCGIVGGIAVAGVPRGDNDDHVFDHGGVVDRRTQRALVDRLRPRSVRQRSTLSHPQHHRRCHQGMSGGDPRYLDLGPPRGP